MRPFHAALGLALGLLPLCAAEPTYGIGLSLRQNEQTIYLPVQLSPSLRLEGSLQFTTTLLKDDGKDVSFRNHAYGVGLFHVRSLSEGFQLYAGPRFSYGKQSSDYSEYSCSNVKAYSITPLLGLEYRLTRNLSLSAEAGFGWSRTETEIYDKLHAWHSSETSRRWDSQTAVVLRYGF